MKTQFVTGTHAAQTQPGTGNLSRKALATGKKLWRQQAAHPSAGDSELEQRAQEHSNAFGHVAHFQASMDVDRIEDLADVALQNLPPAARAARLVKVHVLVSQPTWFLFVAAGQAQHSRTPEKSSRDGQPWPHRLWPLQYHCCTVRSSEPSRSESSECASRRSASATASATRGVSGRSQLSPKS